MISRTSGVDGLRRLPISARVRARFDTLVGRCGEGEVVDWSAMDAERGDKAPVTDRRVTAVFNNVSRQVQFLLDHNRLLINEINQNHEAKIPEGLTRNVTLIRQLNCNIAKVVDLYANLSSNFSNVFENLQEVNSDQINVAGAAVAQSSGQNLHKKLRSAGFS